MKFFQKIPSAEMSQSQLKSDMSYAFNGQYRPILCKYISQVKYF